MSDKSAPSGYTLKVDSNPKGAAIYVDGQFRGYTPSTVSGQKGKYSLKVSLRDYHDHTASVEVAKHESVTYTLAPLTYSVTVDSEPRGAALYLNNRLQGNTPFTLSGLVGRYLLKLCLPGYHDCAAILDNPRRETLSYTLLPITYTLTVLSEPRGAAVYLNGQFMGATPLAVSGLRGSCELKVSLEGRGDYTAVINIVHNETVSVAFK